MLPRQLRAPPRCASRRSLNGRAAQSGTCPIGRGASLSCADPYSESFRVGWSVGHALVHLLLLKAVEVECQSRRWLPKVVIGRLGPRSKPDSAADWLARCVDHTSNSDILELTLSNSRALERQIWTSCRSQSSREGFEECSFPDVRGWPWFWSCRHSRAQHLARALSLGLRSEAPRSPVSTLVERFVGSGRKSPGQRREKSSSGGVAGRRPSPPYSRETSDRRKVSAEP
jgi:hypothetical protein